MVIVGAVLSTMNVALGPAEGAPLPALSVAVPGGMPIARLPSPVILESVTVRVVPVPLTPTEAFTFPFLIRMMSVGASVLELKLGSGIRDGIRHRPAGFVIAADGSLTLTMGGVVSKV